MKKWITLLLGAILIVGITACGADKPATDAGAVTEANGAAKSDGTLNAKELLSKAQEASKNITSMSMTADMKQAFVIEHGGETLNESVDAKIKMDMTKEPLAIYQELKMDMGEAGQQDVKQYITKDRAYMEVGGTWVQLPEANIAEMIAQLEASMNIENQVEQFMSAADEATVTEEGDSYVLSAKLSGDGLKEMAKGLISQSSADAQTLAMLDQMKIQNIELKYTIDKEKYLLTHSVVSMEMDMEVEGQKMSLTMDMNTTMSNFNEVEAIEIPQEVIDNAIQG